MAIHPVGFMVFHAGPAWWTSMAIPRAMQLAWLKMCQQALPRHYNTVN